MPQIYLLSGRPAVFAPARPRQPWQHCQTAHTPPHRRLTQHNHELGVHRRHVGGDISPHETPGIAFTHIHPGIVRTHALQILTGSSRHSRGSSNWLVPLFAVSQQIRQDECAEHMFYALFTERPKRDANA
ncbi:hypothetical protein GGX14DRAFT_569987 [Mycena pura]|uniref:Uncharacterized protein n=1 Tax=Mycena pura TaxID=153505 RepID=A0AAD6V612_9AGAR|nr:hypothetical protein GGX14DRAFT_569987 [Mycena pura]